MHIDIHRHTQTYSIHTQTVYNTKGTHAHTQRELI